MPFGFCNDEIYTLKLAEKKWQKLNILSKAEYEGARIVAKDHFIFISCVKRWDVFDARQNTWLFAKDEMRAFVLGHNFQIEICKHFFLPPRFCALETKCSHFAFLHGMAWICIS